MKTKKPKPIANVYAYVRVSTVDQAERDLSIPAQLDAIRKYCRERGYTIVEEFKEEGASGRDDRRKEFGRMVQAALAPKANVDAIIVYQTSRFFRNALQARVYKERLKKDGVAVLSVCQEVTDDAMGRLIEGIFELIDQYESEINGMRTMAAMRQNATLGYLNGSKAPYGFNAVEVNVGGDRTKRKLAPNQNEAELLKEVMRLYIAGAGAKAVAETLNQRSVSYRNNRPWTKNLVLKVLEDESCVGTYFWGKTDAETGEENDREDWIPIPCEPIVPKDLFALVEEIRARRDPKKCPGRLSSSPLLLAGLLKCGSCGSSYTLESSGKEDPTGIRSYRYYNCSKFFRAGKSQCPGHRYPTERLERAVLEHVAEHVFSVEQVRELLKEIVEVNGLLRKRSTDQRDEWRRQLNEIDRAIQKWQRSFEASNATLEEVGIERLKELRKQKAELEETISKVVPISSPPPHLYKTETIETFRDGIREVFLSDSHELTRNYLRILIDKIVLHGDVAEVVVRTEGAAALMAQDGASPGTLTGPESVLTSVRGWLRVRRRLRTLSVNGLGQIRMFVLTHASARAATPRTCAESAGTGTPIRSVPA
jgi:DNA invertase Pin-like site-specific DNA recombinase